MISNDNKIIGSTQYIMDGRDNIIAEYNKEYDEWSCEPRIRVNIDVCMNVIRSVFMCCKCKMTKNNIKFEDILMEYNKLTDNYNMNIISIKEESIPWEHRMTDHNLYINDEHIDIIDGMSLSDIIIIKEFLKLSPHTTFASRCIDNIIDDDYEHEIMYEKDDEFKFDVLCVETYEDDSGDSDIYFSGCPIKIDTDEEICSYSYILYVLKKLSELLNIECEFYLEGSYEECKTIEYKTKI